MTKIVLFSSIYFKNRDVKLDFSVEEVFFFKSIKSNENSIHLLYFPLYFIRVISAK